MEAVVISGNEGFRPVSFWPRSVQRTALVHPVEGTAVFDPVTFTTDIELLQRFYEARGYYQSRVTYDLQVDDQDASVTAHISVAEHRPVTVADVKVEVTAHRQTRLIFLSLSNYLFNRAGRLAKRRTSRVNSWCEISFVNGATHTWRRSGGRKSISTKATSLVQYTAQPGPHAVFGTTGVEGTEKVDPSLILGELTYQPGEQFSLRKVADSQEKILALGLFRAVQIAPEHTESKPQVVPMQVRVEEKPPREIKAGLKYGTEDEIGAQVEWQHRNWLGGGRQLSFLLKLSSVTRTAKATFVQPHFLSPRTRAVLSLSLEQEDEETFLLNATRFQPRLEHRFSPTLSGFIGYRLEFAKLHDIAPATVRALGQIKRDGVLSGPSLGLVWNTTEDPFNPQEGEVVSLSAEQAGVVWGGDFRFYKFTAEAKKYHHVGRKTVLAGRLKIGFADALGARANIPLFERFYAGGEKSVRGYGRRRLGPLSDADDPLGGLSLIEGSVELRRPLWRELSGALFLDFGQVSLDSLDLPLDDLKFAAGFGVSYTTPVGPLRVDLGFPFDPPRGDRGWQVHFSIGQFF